MLGKVCWCRIESRPSAQNSTRSATGADPEFTYELLADVPSGQSFPSGSGLTQTKQEKVGGRDCYNGGWDIHSNGNTGGEITLKTTFACTQPQVNGQRNFDAGALPRDRWFALKVHEKFSNDPRVGFVQAWKDDDGPGPGGYVEVVPMTHLDNEWGRQVRLRIGSYRGRADIRPGSTSTEPSSIVSPTAESPGRGARQGRPRHTRAAVLPFRCSCRQGLLKDDCCRARSFVRMVSLT